MQGREVQWMKRDRGTEYGRQNEWIRKYYSNTRSMDVLGLPIPVNKSDKQHIEAYEN